VSITPASTISHCGFAGLTRQDISAGRHQEVELRRGRDYVVARTVQPLVGNVLLDAAIDTAHRALDLTSVEDVDSLITHAPADNHITVERAAQGLVVRYQAVMDFPIGVDLEMTTVRADGQIEKQPIPPPLSWTPAFRFHRLSQGSRDLFEAYRNMFLSLEALLDQLFPKSNGENEEEWLLRAMSAASAKIDLVPLASPGATNPAANLVGRLYYVRKQLFHAKTGRTLIPDERISYTKVAEAYPVLLALWTEIVRGWLSLRRGGGLITYQGFRAMIEKAYASVRIGITADTTPPNAGDQAASPRDLPVFTFTDTPSIVELRPGRMAVQGRTDVSALPADQVIGRVLTLNQDDIPLIASSVTGGLTLDEADVFETVQVMRLVNRGQPVSEFS
jgi:hypothetical protein